MRHNGYRRSHYLLRAEEADDIAVLFADEGTRAKWSNIAKAYRLLAGIPEAEVPGDRLGTRT